ncbi:CxxC motif-containing protein [Butyrivibrio fibrisolvens DSM 3071]|jgi:CxxC motif-containing protein|uniref:CxxC motif-containing protein n=1 Tax=Butyrivibrio fibrisolvens DSM 3071 TaxID=1121131 RepID=A0A1M5QIM2_BUTFI|nr:DUF1667 domain-containing protein [Butyrivibrio fibrisolvens]SHH13721.1 CxxC motif-containing protein [Butyrivibrio fibrisolvens DSM 3071]
METRELICIGCPMGCMLTVNMEDADNITVTGNTCPRGEAYGKKEVTNPTRIVTSSVKIIDGTIARVSVKTENDIPKGKIFDIMKEIRDTTVTAPIHIGDVILKNVADTGVDVIATKDVERSAAI